MASFTEEELRAAARILFVVHQRRAQDQAQLDDEEELNPDSPPSPSEREGR
jgi:hypothetical protein